MCGIAGIHTPGRAVDSATLAAMVAEMRHRGPDGEGVWIGEGVGLGMRRLAIVDVEGGDQPLTNESGSIHVVFNGEIYNHEELRGWLRERGHRLASGSDGEVIAHLWEELGPGLCDRLDGIFAIALWDADRRALLLVRDQLGVKPLYVHRSGRRDPLRLGTEGPDRRSRSPSQPRPARARPAVQLPLYAGTEHAAGRRREARTRHLPALRTRTGDSAPLLGPSGAPSAATSRLTTPPTGCASCCGRPCSAR